MTGAVLWTDPPNVELEPADSPRTDTVGSETRLPNQVLVERLHAPNAVIVGWGGSGSTSGLLVLSTSASTQATEIDTRPFRPQREQVATRSIRSEPRWYSYV